MMLCAFVSIAQSIIIPIKKDNNVFFIRLPYLRYYFFSIFSASLRASSKFFWVPSAKVVLT